MGANWVSALDPQAQSCILAAAAAHDLAWERALASLSNASSEKNSQASCAAAGRAPQIERRRTNVRFFIVHLGRRRFPFYPIQFTTRNLGESLNNSSASARRG